MTNFILPPQEDSNNPVIQQKVKAWALKKMAEQFKNSKKILNEDHWPPFVAYKKSEKSEKRSRINKKNATKKKYHHGMGSGG